MSVRRAAYHFRRAAGAFKSSRRDRRYCKLTKTTEPRRGEVAGQVPARVSPRLTLTFWPDPYQPSAKAAALSAGRLGRGLGGRPGASSELGHTKMHDGSTSASEIEEEGKQLTAQLTAFNRVLLRGVKSKSTHGGGTYSDLTDLTDSLRGKDIQGHGRARGRAAASSASLASERIGKFGKIGANRRAFMRFSVNRRQSNRVECRLTSGKIGGWSA